MAINQCAGSLVDEARRLLIKIRDPEHTVSHTLDVVDNVTRIIELREDNSDIDVEQVIICAWWHDTGRLKGNDGHEVRSADLLGSALHKRGFEASYINSCRAAIINHKWDAPMPETIEGQIVRDADKLAFLGLRRWHNCTKAGHELNDIVALLPRLRDKILILPESKILFDIDSVKLIEYLYSLVRGYRW